MTTDNMLDVYAASHPFKMERAHVAVAEGMSLQEIIDVCQPDPYLATHANVLINGHTVPREFWQYVRPKAGTNVSIRVLPAGGGGNKNIVRAIALIAVAVVAGWAAGAMFGAGTTSAIVATGVFTVIGTMAVNALIPPPELDDLDSAGATRRVPSIQYARNRLDPWGTIPQPLGYMRYVPPYAARPYTEIQGTDQYLVLAVCWGRGPVLVDELKIGETPVHNYEEVDIAHNFADGAGWVNENGDPANPLFTNTVLEESVAATLLPNESGINATHGPWINRTTEVDADAISVDIVFPRGLFRVNTNGERRTVRVDAEVEYREVGTSTWKAVTSETLNGIGFRNISTTTTQEIRTRPRDGSQFTVSNTSNDSFSVGDTLTGATSGATATIVSAPNSKQSGLLELSNPQGTFEHGETITDQSGTSAEAVSVLRTEARSPSLLRNTFRWDVPTGQYEVRMRRITSAAAGVPGAFEDGRVQAEIAWSALRTIRNEDAVQMEGVALTTMRIKATDQLNGVVDQINGIVGTIVPDWDSGTQTWVERFTSNPASLALHVLRGPANPNPIPDELIDFEQFQFFHEYCEAEEFQFNEVLEDDMSVREAANAVTSVALGMTHIVDDKWTVVIDMADKPVVQHFTPRNCRNFSSTKAFYDIPDGFRIHFKNPDIGYETDEAVFYTIDNPAEAQSFETVSLFGIVGDRHALFYTKFIHGQALLRPEIYSFETNFQHLSATVGDKIRVNHDVPLWGLASGRIKNLILDGSDIVGVVTDEDMELEANTDYTIRIRRQDSSSDVLQISQGGTSEITNELIFDQPATGINVGDMFMFGLLGQESVDLIIKEIKDGNHDFDTTIVAVDAAEALFDDLDDLPPFETGITVQDPFTRLRPAPPVIEDVISEEFARESSSDTGLPHLRVAVYYTTQPSSGVQPSKVEIRYRVLGSHYTKIEKPISDSVIYIEGVSAGETLEIALRTRTEDGKTSDWVEAEPHFVPYKFRPPQNVLNLTASTANWVSSGSTSYGIRLTWDDVPDPDLAVYEVRTDLSIGTGGSNFLARPRDNQIDLPIAAAGIYTFYVWARDTSGNYSVDPAEVTIEISAPSSVAPTTRFKKRELIIEWTGDAQTDWPIAHYEIRRQWPTQVGTLQAEGTLNQFIAPQNVSDPINFAGIEVGDNISVSGFVAQAGNNGTWEVTDVEITPTEHSVTISGSLLDETREDISVDRENFFDTAEFIDRTDTRKFVFVADWEGELDWYIAAVDVADNIGQGSSIGVDVQGPPQVPDLVAKAISGDVILNWNRLENTLPIEEYLVYRDSDEDASFGDETNQFVTSQEGTFASIKEDIVNQRNAYFIVPVDTAGNRGPARKIVVYVDEPLDFVIQNDFQIDFETGTTSNLIFSESGFLLGPIDTTETWEEHFIGNGTEASPEWPTIDSLITAGYEYYLQPGLETEATYTTPILDVGIPLDSSRITVTTDTVILDGTPDLVVTIRWRETSLDPWEEVESSQVVASSVGEVQVELKILGPNPVDIMKIRELEVRLTVQKVTTEGTFMALASDAPGPTIVTLDRAFSDIRSVSISVRQNDPPTPGLRAFWDVDEVVGGQTDEVMLWAYDENGNRVDAEIAVTVRGIPAPTGV